MSTTPFRHPRVDEVWLAKLREEVLEPEGGRLLKSSIPVDLDAETRYVISLQINIFDPEVVVLGGGLSQIQALYDEVPKRWGHWIFSDAVATVLRPPKFGDSSGVRGAAWLWPAE